MYNINIHIYLLFCIFSKIARSIEHLTLDKFRRFLGGVGDLVLDDFSIICIISTRIWELQNEIDIPIILKLLSIY